MTATFAEQPIPNSPYGYPGRHWQLENGVPTDRIKVNGVDIFDPSTGQVRSDDTDGIACWFVDTDYNEERFFRPPSLLPRRQQRPVQSTENHAESGSRRRRLGYPPQRHLPPLPQAKLRPHRSKGNQPPGRRSDKGAQGITSAKSLGTRDDSTSYIDTEDEIL